MGSSKIKRYETTKERNTVRGFPHPGVEIGQSECCIWHGTFVWTNISMIKDIILSE